ncbi:MAG: ABC transporter permease [Armatimonadota bacterium]
MSDLKLAFIYLSSRKLVTVLTVLSVALGLGLATIVLILARETDSTLRQETARWDMVVGAKGGQLQLVLNSLYYLDAPTGNISTDVWDALKKDSTVTRVVPVSMGDNFFGSPIVGTTLDFFTDRQATNGGPLIAQGQLFTKPLEAVVGADVAKRMSIRLGDKLVGSHGWGAGGGDEHKESPYTVVGILAATGTALDRALYADYRSVWDVHHHDEEEAGEHHEEGTEEHHEEEGKQVTALLVKLSLPGRRFQFVEHVNRTLPAMAAIPVDEIDKITRIFIAPMQGILLLIAYLVVLVAALSILISLYLTIHQRRRDVAIIRSLGATRGDVFRLITLEAAALAGLGVILGWLIGHLVVAGLTSYSVAKFGIAPHAWQIAPVEIVIAATVWGLGILAGLLPAAVAYRLPVADTLGAE